MAYTFDTPEATYATKFINSSNRHIFLTGRAGTGKTTLLKQIVENTHKKSVIAAPTGIAAINAGGVTLHSLFHLPFGTFVPSNNADLSYRINTQLNTPQSLIKGLKMNAQKRNLLNEIELLIIDEVSMLRADLLDAIDHVLRFVRRQRNKPFGGLQILFIGDLWQLPPVIKNEEVDFLKQYYSNFFFFNALALKETPPINLELKHIYRQTDEDFIQVLNNFRTNQVSQVDLNILNECYVPNFNRENNPGYIYLTTHNYKANEINAESLKNLFGQIKTYKASVEGEFNENLYPIDPELELKKDTQVMFVKNDYSGEQAYFNGKIGKIKELGNEYIRVSFDDGSDNAVVERYTWENKKFKLNQQTGEVEENIIGKFIQYPIKLAWAVTIHKSQGLTFSKAILDISDVFASGQTYVALSRLTSLRGLVLSKKVSTAGPEMDVEVSTFAKNQKDENELDIELKKASVEFAKEEAVKAFSFSFLERYLQTHVESYNKDEGKSTKQKNKGWAIEMLYKFNTINEVAVKFQSQLTALARSVNSNSLEQIIERVSAAKGYFEPQFQELAKETTNKIEHISNLKGVKKYTTELKTIDNLFYNQIIRFNKAEALLQSIVQSSNFNKNDLNKLTQNISRPKANEKVVKNKPSESDTRTQSMELCKAGKSIQEIAKERNLATSTIESHLAGFIAKGELALKGLVDEKKIKPIIEALKEFDTFKPAPIKHYLGDGFSYGEIRLVTAHVLWERIKDV